MGMPLLRARKPLLQAKEWNSDGSIEPAARAKWFEAREVRVDTPADLLAIIGAAERLRRVALVKDAIAPGADPMRLRRRCEAGTDKDTGEGYPAGLRVVARHWLVVDVDGLPRPAGIDWREGDALAAYARGLLPGPFQNAACVWQLSGSSGHPTKRGEIRLHLFFMLDAAVFPGAWKRALAHLHFVDLSIFDKAKLIFSAAPVIQAGHDPIAQRHGILDGEPVVRVSDDVLARSVEIARGDGGAKRIMTPVAAAPMPKAAAAFVEILARSNVLRSQHPAYHSERGRRLAFCKVLADSFGIRDEVTLLAAFHAVCVGADDLNGDHDAREALAWARSPSPNGRKFSTRKLLCDASAALHEAGDKGMGTRAARLAMVFAKAEAKGAAA